MASSYATSRKGMSIPQLCSRPGQTTVFQLPHASRNRSQSRQTFQTRLLQCSNKNPLSRCIVPKAAGDDAHEDANTRDMCSGDDTRSRPKPDFTTPDSLPARHGPSEVVDATVLEEGPGTPSERTPVTDEEYQQLQNPQAGSLGSYGASSPATRPRNNLWDALSEDYTFTETVRFLVPVADPDTPVTDVLECPTITDVLMPQDSPFVAHNNWGGGFVHPDDRIALNTLHLSSICTADSTSMCVDHALGNDLEPDPESGMLKRVLVTEGEGDTADMANGREGRILYIPLPPWAIRAGPRRIVYHNPSETVAAVVTCGSLCPGTNDVVQGIVRRLSDYGVPDGNIYGIRNGFLGFYEHKYKPVILTPTNVDGIQLKGGTVLGTSKEPADLSAVVERIKLWGINMLFVIGGDGSNKAAQELHIRLQEESLPCCVVGVPKSIENDILLIDKTFGYETAVEEAQRALEAAHVDATSYSRGVSIVKLMGKKSGSIALQQHDAGLMLHLQASLASSMVDVCLIPEIRFELEGPGGLLAFIDKLLARQGHAVICLAEGAGQDILHHHRRSTQHMFQPAPALATHHLVVPGSHAQGTHGHAANSLHGRHARSSSASEDDRPAGAAKGNHWEGPENGRHHEAARRHAQALHHRAVAAAAVASAGMHLDAAGNPVLRDIGMLLRSRLSSHLGSAAEVTLIDTTPMIRASASHSQDHIYCRILAQAAVDAAFAGYSGVTVGQVNNHMVILPIPVITQATRRVDPNGRLWKRLTSSLQQPELHSGGIHNTSFESFESS